MNPKNIIFDLDGTLIDSISGISFSFGEAIKAVLPGHNVPAITNLIGLPIRKIFSLALAEEDARVLKNLEESFRKSYDSVGFEMCCVYPGVYESLDQICSSGYTCYILTNKPIKPATKIVQKLSLSKFITELFTLDCGYPRFRSKADAALEMKRRLKLEESQVLLVGDSQDDAEAAHQCGFNFIAVAYGYGNIHKNPNVAFQKSINQFEDLNDIIM